MIDERANPPRVAQLLLRAMLRPRDEETVAGDLLEEYRAVRRPSLGPLKAGVWYWAHVLSVVAHTVGPFAIALVAAKAVLAAVMLFPLSRGWNPSLVPAPNVSLLDALFFLAAGYAGARRTGRLASGVVNAAALGLIDFASFAVFTLLLFPTLPGAIWVDPFIAVIGCTFLALAVAFALAFGTAGAAVGGWTTRRVAR